MMTACDVAAIAKPWPIQQRVCYVHMQLLISKIVMGILAGWAGGRAGGWVGSASHPFLYIHVRWQS